MKINLNYRDRMILLGFLVVVIFVLGFVLLIKPTNQKIATNQTKLDSTLSEWQTIETRINQIPTLQDKIQGIYAESKGLSDNFYNENLETFELDQFIQPTIDECGIRVNNLELGTASNTELKYYYYTPVIATSSIFDLADINGNYTAERNEKLIESSALALRTVDSLYSQQIGLNVTVTKEQLWNFMDAIESLDKSIIIESVNISDYDFGWDRTTNQFPEDAETTIDSEGKTVGYSTVTLVLTRYSVYELDEPNVD